MILVEWGSGGNMPKEAISRSKSEFRRCQARS